MKKNTQITLNVTLDENNNPIQMTWSAPDGGIENYDMDAFFLSTWNKTNQESSRIDLWIKKMPIDQMHVFTHQTLVGIKESYFKATEDKKMLNAFEQFCNYFEKEKKLKSLSKKFK